MTQLGWQNVLSRALVEVLLALTVLLIAFIVWLLLRKFGLFSESFVESWSRWDRWSQSLSHSVLIWLLVVVALALFVIWDSR